MPNISLQQRANNIEVVEQFKLLGQIISKDMKTIANTQNICNKAYTRMWILRRLKELGCPTEELLDVLRQQILSVVEQAVPYWAPLITKHESQLLERILKTSLHIILQEKYVSFQNALKVTHMRSLSQRRKEIVYKFCKKAEKSEVFSKWFSKYDTETSTRVTRVTRKNALQYKPVTCRTTRYERSPLPTITNILSWHPPKVFISPKMF